MADREIVSRADWGAAPPEYRNYIETPSSELWLHHTAGALDAGGNGVWWDDARAVQEFHMRPVADGGRGWSDLAYSFLIGGGMIFEGRGVGVAGGHTKGRNFVSHAICLFGNYDVMRPTDEDLAATAWLIAHGRERGWWHDLTGAHTEAPGAATSCCGRHLIDRIPDLRRIAALGTEAHDMQYDAPTANWTIDRLYEVVAGRTPSASARDYWLGELQRDGSTVVALLAGLLAERRTVVDQRFRLIDNQLDRLVERVTKLEAGGAGGGSVSDERIVAVVRDALES